MFLAISLLLQILVIPTPLTGVASADVLTEFGMNGNPTSVSLNFGGPGYDVSTNITLSHTSTVSTANIDVRGLANSTGISPTTIGVDVGNDGDLEWGFGGLGNGSFGHVTEFSNGWEGVGVNLSTGHNNSYSIRLPIDATITSATFDIASLSELTLSGGDVRDSYIHQPNPTWGNNTYKDCNYGASPVTITGKTQWSNWHIYRSLYWFDLSTLPGATVLSSELQLYVENVVTNANTGQPVTTQHTYTLHPLLKEWEEGLENNVPVQQGPGVTWKNAIDNVTGSDYNWAIEGAGSTTLDRASAIDSFTGAPANMEGTWIVFNSTGLLDLTREWVNGSDNYGLMLLGDENTNKPDASMIQLTGRQNSTHGPRLVVVFAGEDDVSAGVDVNGDGIEEWSHAGNLTSGSSIPDFSSTLNSYLASATPSFIDDYGNAFVDVPLNISGNATLVLDNIDVHYDWTPSITNSPHGSLEDELNDHITNLIPDTSGNISIPFNVTSGSAGVIELSNLQINTGERPPTIGSIILPSETIVPDGKEFLIGAEVTSYQGVSNLSWVTITPQLTNIGARPIFHYSFPLSVTSVTDPGGLIRNVSGSVQILNNDTALIEWNFSTNWNWEPEQGVNWLVEVNTVDSLLSTRISTQTTTHERQMEIISFKVFDETSPTEGSPEIQEQEWVAGGDVLRCTGEVQFLNSNRNPLPGEVIIELINVSGNGTVDVNGLFDIVTQAPFQNYPNGFTIGAQILGLYDSTPIENVQRTMLIDGTPPGIQINSPLEERVQPYHQNLFNVSIADSIGMPDIFSFYWWVEGIHDNGDGIPQSNEYATKDLMRQQNSEFFHATFDDTSNGQGQWVSLYIEGADNAGNTINGGSPGFNNDLLHFSSLVPTPTILSNTSREFSGGQTLVPTNLGWLNFSLYDENGVEDIEAITIDLGQGTLLNWNINDGNMISNDIEFSSDYFSIEGEDENISVSVSLLATPWFNPTLTSGDIVLNVIDSSGLQTFSTGLDWNFNADIQVIDFMASSIDVINGENLQENSWVKLGANVEFSGSISYTSANIAPPEYCYELQFEVPLGNPIPLSLEGSNFSDEIEVQNNGIHKVNLIANCGISQVQLSHDSIHLRVDAIAPVLVSNQPTLVSANSTSFILQLDVSESESGLQDGDFIVNCTIRRGLNIVGESFSALAEIQLSSDVSRYLVELNHPSPKHGDVLECWFTLSDNAGNHLTGKGSSYTWPLQLPVIEQRSDLSIHYFEISPSPLTGGDLSEINITISNLGESTDEKFTVSIWILDEEVGNHSIRFLEGESRAETSFSWQADWLGELDVIVILDPEHVIDEQDENNSWSFTIDVQMKQEPSIFSSNAFLMATSIGGILFAVICLLLLLRYLMSEEDDYEEWDDDEEDLSLTEVRQWKDEEGRDWRELSDGSYEWWEEESRSWQSWER
jgi:hypothetical protein